MDTKIEIIDIARKVFEKSISFNVKLRVLNNIGLKQNARNPTPNDNNKLLKKES
tara:strand:+ start:244 stop:405 length:162 start_codon:yes stop_codon:yes gene_type:complete